MPGKRKFKKVPKTKKGVPKKYVAGAKESKSKRTRDKKDLPSYIKRAS